MMRTPLASLALLSCLCTVVPAAAQAQPASTSGAAAPRKAVLPRPLADAMTNKARDLYTEGVKAMAEQRIADARAAFVGAWALEQNYSIACNLGDAELRLGRHREAAEKLLICIQGIDKDSRATDAERTAVKKLFANAKTKTVELIVTASAAQSPSPSATVTIDGVAAGQAAPELHTFVDPGKHVVTIEADGYVAIREEIEGAEGAAKHIQKTLQKKDISVDPSASATATAKPPPPPARSMVPVYVVGGIGVLSAAIGGVLIGIAETEGAQVIADAPRDEDGQPICRKTPTPPSATTPECEAWRAKGAQASALGNAGVGLFVVAGVAAAGAVGYLLWPSKTQSARSVQVAPFVSANSGGAFVQGRF